MVRSPDLGSGCLEFESPLPYHYYHIEINMINLRVDKKEILKELTANKLFELEKIRLENERSKINLLHGEDLKNVKIQTLWTRIILISIILGISTGIFSLLSTVIITVSKNITHYNILKLGYEDLDDNYLKSNTVKTILEHRLILNGLSNKSILINGTLIPFEFTKKDSIVIKQKIDSLIENNLSKITNPRNQLNVGFLQSRK